MRRPSNKNPIKDEEEQVSPARLRQLLKDEALLKAVRDAGVFDDPRYGDFIMRIAMQEYNWHQM